MIYEMDEEMDAPCNCPLCEKVVELDEMVPHPGEEESGGTELICKGCAAKPRVWRVVVSVRSTQAVEVLAPTEHEAIEAAIRQVKGADDYDDCEYLGEDSP